MFSSHIFIIHSKFWLLIIRVVTISCCSIHPSLVFSSYPSSNFFIANFSLSTYYMYFHFTAHVTQNLFSSRFTVTTKFLYFVPVSITTVNWDCSELLLLSEDLESNLGLRPIDKSPVICIICSSKINRGIQQSMPPMCSGTDCYA